MAEKEVEIKKEEPEKNVMKESSFFDLTESPMKIAEPGHSKDHPVVIGSPDKTKANKKPKVVKSAAAAAAAAATEDGSKLKWRKALPLAVTPGGSKILCAVCNHQMRTGNSGKEGTWGSKYLTCFHCANYVCSKLD